MKYIKHVSIAKAQQSTSTKGGLGCGIFPDKDKCEDNGIF